MQRHGQKRLLVNPLVIDEEFPYPLNRQADQDIPLTKVLSTCNRVLHLAYGSIDSEAAQFLQNHDITCRAVAAPVRRQSHHW